MNGLMVLTQCFFRYTWWLLEYWLTQRERFGEKRRKSIQEMVKYLPQSRWAPNIVDMFISQLDEAIKSGQPFAIFTSDGKEHTVPTPDHIFVSPKRTFIQIVDDEDRITSISPRAITSVKYQGFTDEVPSAGLKD